MTIVRRLFGRKTFSRVSRVGFRRAHRRLCHEQLEARSLLAVCFVSNTSNDPATPGSLPWSINQANSHNCGTISVPERIEFINSIAQINLGSAALPDITGTVVIDGLKLGLEERDNPIRITGTTLFNLFDIDAANPAAGPIEIRGVDMFGFPNPPIRVTNVPNDGVVIEDNFIHDNGDSTNDSAVFVADQTNQVKIQNNFIYANSGDGIFVDPLAAVDDDLLIESNFIGRNLPGTILGNGRHGVHLSGGAARVVIQNNEIAGSGDDGISLSSSALQRNRITNNTFIDNGNGASDLPIDLSNNGPSTNDPGDGDSGPNDRLNYPVIDTENIAFAFGLWSIPVSIDADSASAGKTYLFEFYKHTPATNEYRFMRAVSETLGANGDHSFPETFASGGGANELAAGDFLSVIAIHDDNDATGLPDFGNTSEFAPPVEIIEPDPFADFEPDAPDLLSADDTGQFNDDEVTKIDLPRFTGTVLTGAYVRLLANGNVVNAVQLGSTTTNYMIAPSSALAHGLYNMQITVAANSSSPQSAPSPPLQVTIDTMAPRVNQVKARNGGTEFQILALANSDVQVRPVTLTGGVDDIQVLFDEDVLAPAGAVRLAGVFGGVDTEYSLSVFPGTTASSIMTATIGGAPITRDQLWLMLESGESDVRDRAGNPLDGDWVSNPTGWGDNSGNATYPSGNGVAGGNFNFKILVLEAGTLIGDTHDDGRVDTDDLNDVRNNFGQTGAADGSLDGDAFVYDGVVDIDDLNSVRNNFGNNVADWPSEIPPGPPGAMATSGPGGSAATKGAKKPAAVGEELMKNALRGEFDRTIAVGKPSEYVRLFGWDKLGNAAWWDGVLGAGWQEKLATAAPATGMGAMESGAATSLPATFEHFVARVAMAIPADQNPAATGAVLQQTDFLNQTDEIVDTIAPPADSRHQNPLSRRSSRGHQVDSRWLPTWDAALVPFEDTMSAF